MADKADITIVLDASGSMDSIKSDTIGGFNSFVAEQQKLGEGIKLSLVQFDSKVRTIYEGVDIQFADKLNDDNYLPGNTTALLDAIGLTIDDTGKRLRETPQADRPEKVIIAIITDGLENASYRYTLKKVFEMIDHQKTIYKWEFLFLGANQDAIASASKMGIDYGATMSTASSPRGTRMAYDQLSKSVSNYVAGASAQCVFSDEDREAQLKEGATPPSTSGGTTAFPKPKLPQ